MKGEGGMATHPFVDPTPNIVEIRVIATNNQAPSSLFLSYEIRSRKE
jgi:hypothetical protein